MKKNILKKVGIGIGLGLTLMPFLALAIKAPPLPISPLITNPNDIRDIIQSILNWIASVVMIISIIMLLYAAILFLTAGASETTHGKAKSVLVYAIVGIAVAILAFSVQPLITNLLQSRF